MKKLLSLVMLLSFVTVQANAATFNGLESAFKEFSYTVGSEIDPQTDKELYKEATKKMNAAIEKAQKEGMTNAELIEFAKSKIVDPTVREAFENATTMVQLQALSSKEARKLIIDAFKNSFAEGAQWSPAATYSLLAVIFIAAAIAAAASGGTVVVDGGGYYGCYDEYVCYDYYDYFWGWYTDCYWETYCY
jgi:hypothetical protein